MRNIYDMKNNLKNHTQNVVEKVFPDLILKYQNWAIQFLLFKCRLSKYNEIKLQTTCFYLLQSFLEKQKET